jgi:hypothetical protein
MSGVLIAGQLAIAYFAVPGRARRREQAARSLPFSIQVVGNAALQQIKMTSQCMQAERRLGVTDHDLGKCESALSGQIGPFWIME